MVTALRLDLNVGFQVDSEQFRHVRTNLNSTRNQNKQHASESFTKGSVMSLL